MRFICVLGCDEPVKVKGVIGSAFVIGIRKACPKPDENTVTVLEAHTINLVACPAKMPESNLK